MPRKARKDPVYNPEYHPIRRKKKHTIKSSETSTLNPLNPKLSTLNPKPSKPSTQRLLLQGRQVLPGLREFAFLHALSWALGGLWSFRALGL